MRQWKRDVISKVQDRRGPFCHHNYRENKNTWVDIEIIFFKLESIVMHFHCLLYHYFKGKPKGFYFLKTMFFWKYYLIYIKSITINIYIGTSRCTKLKNIGIYVGMFITIPKIWLPNVLNFVIVSVFIKHMLINKKINKNQLRTYFFYYFVLNLQFFILVSISLLLISCSNIYFIKFFLCKTI